MSALIGCLRSARKHDVSSVVNVHIAAFPDFFLTNLGSVFLKIMYQALLSNAGSIFIIASTNQKVQGFAVGQPKSAGGDQILALRFLPLFLIAVIPGILRNPLKVSRRILSQLLMVGTPLKIPNNAIVLRSIGVLPEARGTGLARKLLKEFERCSHLRGVRAVALTTDAIDNERALAFYSKNGYEVIQEFTQDNSRQMLLMVKQLDEFAFKSKLGANNK